MPLLAEAEGEEPNSPPFAGDDLFMVQHDTTLSDSVALNDWDMEGDPLTFSLVSGTSNGTLSFGGGSFTYIPNALFAGGDSFVYAVSDGQHTVSATASIHVQNTAPNGSDDLFMVQHDTTLSDSVALNDWDMEADPLTFALVSGTSNGTIEFNSDGSFTYVPNVLYAGEDSFVYSVTDQIETVTVNAYIHVQNTAPEAADDMYMVLHGVELNDSVALNDWDMEADALTFSLVSGTSNGTLEFYPDGSFMYLTLPDFLEGGDSFTYEVTDGIEARVATAFIQVMPPMGVISVTTEGVDEGDEGRKNLTFTVTYTGDKFMAGFNVTYTTIGGTATGSNDIGFKDYIDVSGTLAFSGAPGESKTVTVEVVGDKITELDERFYLDITGVNKPNIELPDRTPAWIRNDDHSVVNLNYRFPDQTLVPEKFTDGFSYFSYEIRLVGMVDLPVTVFFQVDRGDAEPTDFGGLNALDEQSTTIYSSPVYEGGRSTQGVIINDDTMVEPAVENYSIKLVRIEADGRDVRIGNSPLEAGILDDDDLTIIVENFTKAEGTGGGHTVFNVPVRLGNQVEGGVTISLEAVDYTAKLSENDFSTTTTTVHFDQEQTTGHAPVLVTANDKREANEKFTLNVVTATSTVSDVQIEQTGGILGPQNQLWHLPFGLVTIKNDDEGIYTNTGGGSIAFYDGADGGGGGSAGGAAFKAEAEARYAVSHNVGSFFNLLIKLEAHVSVHGRVSELAIFDHGAVGGGGQFLGTAIIDREEFEALAPFLNDGALIWLFGCDVGLNQYYNDWISDDAGPAAITKSAPCLVWYPGAALTPGHDWILWNGYEKP